MPLVLDPLAEGPLPHALQAYDFGMMLADDGGASPVVYPMAVRGEITFPTQGDGPFPVVLLMHGRHGTCKVLGFELLGAYACPNAVVMTPVDSFTGYRYLAGNLASHGYVVASIDANHVNERDQALLLGAGDYGATARAQLVLRTLDMLARINATGTAGDAALGPQELPLKGKLDLSRVGLMGHSRGGEGVARGVTLHAEAGAPHGIKAVFALAPTDFARWPIPGVAFATILPYCDGDVYNLQGAWLYDDARAAGNEHPLYQVVARGANHNWYNTVWTGDDWGFRQDPWCNVGVGESGRDSTQSQQAHGLAVMASFLRMHVGDEDGFAPFWTGEVPFPPAVCPDHGSCVGRLLVSRHAAAGHRLDLAGDGFAATRSDSVAASGCSGRDCSLSPTYSLTPQTHYEWDEDATIAFSLDSLRRNGLEVVPDVLTFRVATRAPVEVAVALVSGGELTPIPMQAWQAAALDEAPGAQAYKAVLSMVRVDLRDIDLAGATAIELQLAGAGEMQLADVLLQVEP
ncbi:MAG TPA: hypothetical protein VFH47_05570 [Candidatus Thermoplasmatota archaeon]|nr:hypothetical protein [Candidatus Thermoplasmatota archaeon]